MYELGYAHALGKPTIIMNQSVRDSPFDIKDFRQIVYNRNQLAKDCRPRVIASLAEVFAEQEGVEPDGEPYPSPTEAEVVSKGDDRVLPPIVPSDRLVNELQTMHLKMQLANTKSDNETVHKLSMEVFALVDRISVVGSVDTTDLENAAGTVGNCAVELESAALYGEAEDLWKRAIGLCPNHAGLHIQYGNFLVDQSRVSEATEEFQRARTLRPTDKRIRMLEVKIALASKQPDPEIRKRLFEVFEKNPGDSRAAATLVLYLSQSGATLEEFETVCKQWKEAAPDQEKDMPLRALADRLAKCGENKRAAQIYDEILPRLQGENRHDVLHNLATVYDELGLKEKAEACWRESYQIDPADPAVRASFSQRLAGWGRLSDAIKVSSGDPL